MEIIHIKSPGHNTRIIKHKITSILIQNSIFKNNRSVQNNRFHNLSLSLSSPRRFLPGVSQLDPIAQKKAAGGIFECDVIIDPILDLISRFKVHLPPHPFLPSRTLHIDQDKWQSGGPLSRCKRCAIQVFLSVVYARRYGGSLAPFAHSRISISALWHSICLAFTIAIDVTWL